MKIFDTVRPTRLKRSTFDLSHERKLSMRMGVLTPVLCLECVPGDDMRISTESFIRFAPMVSPVMHRIDAFIHYFFVPYRLIWEEFEEFNVQGNAANIVPPHQDIFGQEVPVGGLADHLGIPVGAFNALHQDINTLPFRAYYKIFNDYYRDENLQLEIDPYTIEVVFPQLFEVGLTQRCWQKDYFTSAFTEMQKGEPVSVHVDASVKDPTRIAHSDGSNVGNDTLTIEDDAGGLPGKLKTASDGKNAIVQPYESLSVDITELRVAVRVQRYLERLQKAGTRYAEHLLGNWGIMPEDHRLQRAEYLGGGKSPCVISEVLNTMGSEDPDALPQGNMAGHGLSVGQANQAHKFCKEHGFIMGIMSVMPQTAYFQGLHRMFSRMLYADYYQPEFANLQEQAVKNKEIYLKDVNDGSMDTEFGYQARYAEYKYALSSIHGDFRTDMDHFHMARKFTDTPVLNASFVSADPTTHIFAVTGKVDNLWVQLYHNIVAKRPMPFYDNPGL